MIQVQLNIKITEPNKDLTIDGNTLLFDNANEKEIKFGNELLQLLKNAAEKIAADWEECKK